LRTITFYSYRGGSGRTRVLSEVAKHLARGGQSVVAMDLDLRAPGLHYSLPPIDGTCAGRGVVDWVWSLAEADQRTAELNLGLVDIPGDADSPAPLYVLPAGDALSHSYWHRLAALDRHHLLCSGQSAGQAWTPPPPGAAYLLELQQRIEQQHRPHFLLVSSPGGVTDLGAVATSVLADTVVCLVPNTQEGLAGTRVVLWHMGSLRRPPGAGPVEIVLVLCLQDHRPPHSEQEAAANAVQYLSDGAISLAQSPELRPPLVLHVDPGDGPGEVSPYLEDCRELARRLM